MSDVDGDTHIREVKPVAQPDQADSDDVMGNQLLEVLPRLLKHQQQHDSLLGPVTSLEKVICLDNGFVGTVGETFVHADGVEVPHGSAGHDPDTERTIDGKVQGRVRLFHEAGLLVPVPDPEMYGDGANEALHAEFSGETQDDNVKCHESKVSSTFAIVPRSIEVFADVGGDEGIIACERVRKEDASGQRIRRVRVDKIKSYDCETEDEREQPCVSYAHALRLGKVTTRRLSF